MMGSKALVRLEDPIDFDHLLPKICDCTTTIWYHICNKIPPIPCSSFACLPLSTIRKTILHHDPKMPPSLRTILMSKSSSALA